MQRITKKLSLNKETIRSLANSKLSGVNGGISGPRGCHSIDDRCPEPSGGVTCNSADNICPSGAASVCSPSFCGGC
jgi:hypothetical protein